MQSLEGVCCEIRHHHRTRQFLGDQRRSALLALGGFLRHQMGWHEKGDDRDEITEKAKALVDYGQDRMDIQQLALRNAERKRKYVGKVLGPPPPYWGEWGPVVDATFKLHEVALKRELENELAMVKLAETLPVWGVWAKHVKGLGALQLAIIVAESTRDEDDGVVTTIGQYKSKAGLWKRMGVATVDGIRQGGLLKTAKAEKWVEHGYSKRRRSRMYMVGAALLKAGDATYRAHYDAFKTEETARAKARGLKVVPAAKIKTGGEPDKISEGQIHLRAQRKMEKTFLKDLRHEWRRANDQAQPGPAAQAA